MVAADAVVSIAVVVVWGAGLYGLALPVDPLWATTINTALYSPIAS